MIKKTLSLFLVLGILVGATVPAYATEDEALQPPPPVEEVNDAVTVEPAPLSDTQGTETDAGTNSGITDGDMDMATIEITSVEELQDAIYNAADGDIITITQTIEVTEDYIIGDDAKIVTLLRSDDMLDIGIEISAGDVVLQNLIFDGNDIPFSNSMVSVANANITMNNTQFKNNSEGALSLGINTTAEISNCRFTNNGTPFSMGYLGHYTFIDCVFEDNTGVFSCISVFGIGIFERCIFQNNSTQVEGGILFVLDMFDDATNTNNTQVQITDCQFIDNTTAEGRGGAIFNGGSTTLTNCFFVGNSSPIEGNDIYNWGHGEFTITDDVDAMETLYKNHDLQFDGLYVDTVESRYHETDESQEIDLPVTSYIGAVTFASSEIPEITLVPDDTEDDTAPTTSYKPSYRPSTSTVTQVVEDTEVTAEVTIATPLTCGEAEIDMTRSITLQGYGDGEIHEEDALTRGQFSVILYRLLTDATIEKYTEKNSVFSDVSADDWYYEYINTIANAGIVFGTGNDQFSPNSTLTWAQALTVLSRFVEVESYTLENILYDGWAKEAVETAVANSWIADDATIIPDAPITRGEMVALINGVLALYR